MFNPTLDTRLVIDDHTYTFAPHPVVPTIPWGQEGRHAIVFRIESHSEAFALKVFRPAFRHEGLIDAANGISLYHELPGMRVCRQIVFTRETHGELITRYEDLDYAMMMPWIDGLTWFDVLQRKDRVTLDQSRALAESMAWVLYGLEYNHLAHCDLSSGNVIVAPDMVQINLIDVEDLYTPWLEPPPYVSTGSMGYQHGESMRSGQWSPIGDRFAGAVLVAEMLGWAHPEVRRQAWGESYFAPDELQKDSARYTTLVEAIRLYDPGFAEAFEQAWRSRALETCPPLKTWYDLLDRLPRDPVASWAPIDPALFAPEGTERKRFPGAARRDRGDATPPPTGANPRAGALQRNTRGCRRLVVISGLIFTVVCCFLSILAVQIAVINTLSAR